MTLFFIILVVLGTVNFLAVLIYYKKVKKLDGGQQRFHITTKKNSWNSQLFERLKQAITGDVRSVKSTYRNMKPKDAFLFIGLFLAGVYINFVYLKFNIIIASLLLLILLNYVHYKSSQKNKGHYLKLNFRRR